MKIFTKLTHQQFVVNSKTVRLLTIKYVCLIILVSFSLPGSGQNKSTGPNWWFGLAGGANLNLYNGSTSSLNLDIAASPAFDKGRGLGGNLMGLIEFRKPGLPVGFMLVQGVDDRSAEFKESGNDFQANIGYYTVEPSITFSPRGSGLYFHAGPRLGLLWTSSFKYLRPSLPNYPNEADPNAEAYIRNLRKNPVSLQVGVGYNIMLSSKMASTQMAISPFVTYLPSLGQNLRTIESLKLNTIRAGIVIKAGCRPRSK